MKKRTVNYYFLTCKYTPYLCSTISAMIVISEEVEEFASRNMNKEDVRDCDATFEIVQWKSTTKAYYNKLKKNNPGSGSYFCMHKSDISH